MNPNRFFILGCVFEGGLLILGAGLCWLFGLDCSFRWNWSDALLGLAGCLPPLGLFYWTLRSQWRPLREIRRFLDEDARPLFQGWPTQHLLLISLLAGLGEEFLFRGAIQGGLAKLVGDLPALLLASLIFGCLHPMTRAYLVLTTLIGLYLGACWLWTGNLLVPVVIHAVYDFVALVFLFKIRGANPNGS